MTSSRLDIPGLNPEEPIPNAPFYSPETDYLQGAYSPITVGGGLEIDAATGSLTLDDYPTVISYSLTLHCDPDGSDVTGDGSAENPWYSPAAAMDFLSSKIIPADKTVTISVADGVYNFTSPIYLNHPNGERIIIAGASSIDTAPLAYSVVNGGGAGYNPTVAAYILSQFQAAFPAQFYFSGCSGFLSTTGGGTTITRLLIAGDNTTLGTVGVGTGSVFPFNNISEANPYTKAIVASSTIRLGAVGITNWKGAGILANGGGISLLPITTNSLVFPRAASIAGNDDNGGSGTGFGGGIVACNGGKVFGDLNYVSCNTIGVRAYNAGFVGIPGTRNGYNSNVAVASQNGTINIAKGNVNGTVDNVAYIEDGGWISIEDTNPGITNQSGYVARVVGSGYIQAKNGQSWLNPTYDPAVNTIGNGIGYINTL